MRVFGARILAATAMAAMALPGSAIAQEARDFADKLSAAIKSFSAIDIEFGAAVNEGNNIVLSDINIGTIADSRAGEMLDGTITFSGITSTPDGGYLAEQAVFGDVDFSDDGVRVQIRNIVARGIEILGDPDDIMQSVVLYKGLQVGPVAVSFDDSEVFSIESIGSSFDINDQRSEFVGGYSIEGIYGDLSQVDDSDLEDALKMFGLTELNASMQGDMTWLIEDGLLSVQDSIIAIEGVGEVVVNVDVVGYTMELLRTIQEQSKAMQNIDPSSSAAEMAGLQMLMSMASQMSLGELSIRFNDDSLTYNIIDFVAAEQGESRKGFISMISSVLPMMLGPIGIPTLQQQISDAAMEFLVNPQNIEIKASPAEPVPFMALMAVAQNPSIADDLLNISVTANQ